MSVYRLQMLSRRLLSSLAAYRVTAARVHAMSMRSQRRRRSGRVAAQLTYLSAKPFGGSSPPMPVPKHVFGQSFQENILL